MENIIERIMNLYAIEMINHATWANALAYVNGTYGPFTYQHELCRLDFKRCMEV